MQIQSSQHENTATVRLNGHFQFDSHREFRAAYDPWLTDGSVQTIAIDFSAVDYLDSAALGMLLLLREKAAAANKGIELVGTRGAVRQVLDVANFSRLFTIR